MSFGWSAGDIATAISILIDVVQALDEADGASADYRRVSAFLTSLTSTLSTLQILSSMPAVLSISLSDKIKEIQEPVKKFQDKIETYKAKLGVPPKTGLLQHFRHVKTKLRWYYGPMKEAVKLKDQIGRQLQVLDTALLQVISTSVLKLPSELRAIFEDIVSTQLASLQEKVVPMITKIADEQDAQAHRYKSLMLFLQTNLISGFGALERDQIEANSLQTKILDVLRGYEPNQIQCLGPNEDPTSQSPAEKGPSALSFLRNKNKDTSRWISDAKIALHVKTLMFFILVSLQYLLSNLWIVICRVSQSMSRMLMQITVRDNVFFIDGIGRNWELHTDFVRNFKVFNCFLEGEFQGEAGFQWVQRGLYQLLDDESGRDITPQSWKTMIKPGKTFSMSMIVEVIAKSMEAYISTCPAHPYCKGSVMRKPGADWAKCSICEIEIYIPGKKVKIPKTEKNRVVEIDDDSTNVETPGSARDPEGPLNKTNSEPYGPVPPPDRPGPAKDNLNTSHIAKFRRITQKIVYQPPYDGIASLILYWEGSDRIWVEQAISLAEMLVDRERTSTKIIALPNGSDTGQYNFAGVNAAISEHLTGFGRRNILFTICFCGASSGPMWTAIGGRNANAPKFLLSRLEEIDADVLFTHFTERQVFSENVVNSSYELPSDLPLGPQRAMAITSLASDIQQTIFSSAARAATKSITRDAQSSQKLVTDDYIQATLQTKELSNDSSKRPSAPFGGSFPQQRENTKDGVATESTGSRESPSNPINSAYPGGTGSNSVADMKMHEGLSSYQGWYMPRSAEPGSISEEDDQVKFSFEQLFNLMKESKDWPANFNHALNVITKDDLQKTLVEVKKIYERKCPERTKVEKYLTRLISRTLYLSSTMDVLGLHRPEYIGLLWGSIAVLILTVVNHEELVYQFSKGLVEILDTFPRTEVYLVLYPCARMRAAVGKLYATLVEFLCKAIAWMKEARLRHSIASIARPFEPNFKGVVEKAAEISRTIDEMALLASTAELREIFSMGTRAILMNDLEDVKRLTKNLPLPSTRGSAKDATSFRSSFSL